MPIGFQFHLEKAISQKDSKDANEYMDYDIALKIFSYFIKNNDTISNSKNFNNTTEKIHSINFDKNAVYFDGEKIKEYDYVWHIDSKGDYNDVKDSPSEYYTGEKPDESEDIWIAHDIKYFPIIDKNKFYKVEIGNDPEWATNYENEKYKDLIFANLPRDYDGDEIPEYMMHSEEEAYKNPCIHIKKPGTYELSGEWKGQIFVDLGKGVAKDSSKKINLLLNNLKVDCTVGPAIYIYRTYECDNTWEERKETTKDIDINDAGANIIVKDNTKKLYKWCQCISYI